MKVLLDNNLSKRLASAINALVEPDSHAVKHLSELFATETPDTEWIKTLGRQGDWIVISGDLRINRSKPEREAWHEAGLVIFFLARGWSDLPNLERAWRMIRWWPLIEKQVPLVEPPVAFEIPVAYRTGRFRVLSR